MENLDQTLFNWVLGVVAAGGGFFLSNVWGAVRDLQKSDISLAEKVASIEVLVAGDYVRKSEFKTDLVALFQKLDRIEDKLDKKVDKV